jgi:hypothetical protein
MFGRERYLSKREPSPGMAAQKAPVPIEVRKEEPKQRELFVRNKDLKIRRRAPVNDTGSLTNLNDPRSYLYGFERPIDVGSFIDIKIASNRVESKPNGGDQKSETPGQGSEKPSAATPEKVDGAAGAKDILKSLPNLEPFDAKAEVIKSLKMEVMEKFDNGDILVMHRRRSVRDGQASEISVTSRVPAVALARQDDLLSTDLVDVDWRESFDGEIIERKSANWEDEYTMRLSGFEESKSKTAMALEEKREQIKAAREKLEKDIKQHISERDKMSKERAKLIEDKDKDSKKVAELTAENEELKKKVDEAEASEKESKDGDGAGEKAGDNKKSGEMKNAQKKPDPKKPNATATEPKS